MPKENQTCLLIIKDTESKNKKSHKNKDYKYGKRSEKKKINIIGVQEKQKTMEQN